MQYPSTVIGLGLGAFVAIAGACKRESSAQESTPAPAAPAIEAPTPVAPAAANATPTPAVSAVVPARNAASFATIDPAALRRHVEVLADDANAGRPTPSPGLEAAAAYVVARFEALGLETPAGAPGHRQSFACGAGDPSLASNLVGVLRGRDPALASQYVMVSAHYDHIGTADVGDDRIFNGANDDASGVAAMLEIAASFAPTPPRRSVAFVAFCGEEQGLRGSQHWVDDPPLPLADTIADVNLEMLGRPGATPKRAWITGKPYSDLGASFDAAAVDLGFEFRDGGDIGRMEGSVFDRSDNWPLARAGVVAHSVSTGVLDSYYHHVDDEPGLLEYDAMAGVVGAVAWATWRLAEADAAPQWTAAGREVIARP